MKARFRAWGPRLRRWSLRYLPAEMAGTATALLGAHWALLAGLPESAVAYAGAWGENVGYYLTMAVIELAVQRRGSQTATNRGFVRSATRTLRTLLIEFGPAELLDSLIVRPAAMFLLASLSGPTLGVVLGKLAADACFYVPVIATYEWRRRGTRAASQSETDD